MLKLMALASLALFGCATCGTEERPPEFSTEDGYSREPMTVFVLPEDMPPMGTTQEFMEIVTVCGTGGRIAICGMGNFHGTGYIVTTSGCKNSWALPMNKREYETFCSPHGEI